jgi:hypothetical protein
MRRRFCIRWVTLWSLKLRHERDDGGSLSVDASFRLPWIGRRQP